MCVCVCIFAWFVLMNWKSCFIYKYIYIYVYICIYIYMYIYNYMHSLFRAMYLYRWNIRCPYRLCRAICLVCLNTCKYWGCSWHFNFSPLFLTLQTLSCIIGLIYWLTKGPAVNPSIIFGRDNTPIKMKVGILSAVVFGGRLASHNPYIISRTASRIYVENVKRLQPKIVNSAVN